VLIAHLASPSRPEWHARVIFCKYLILLNFLRSASSITKTGFVMQRKYSMRVKWLSTAGACSLAAALLLAPAVQSATVYRSVDADGKVVYSDKPPANGKVERQLHIASGPTSPLPDSVLRYQADLEKSMKKRLADAAAPPVGVSILFTTKTCGYCIQAKAYLTAKGLPYQEHDIETPDGMKICASTGGGRSGVPVLVQNDKRVVGFSPQIYDSFFGQPKNKS
jgi:glutaredoxin